jgi:hypothetical protein
VRRSVRRVGCGGADEMHDDGAEAGASGAPMQQGTGDEAARPDPTAIAMECIAVYGVRSEERNEVGFPVGVKFYKQRSIQGN